MSSARTPDVTRGRDDERSIMVAACGTGAVRLLKRWQRPTRYPVRCVGIDISADCPGDTPTVTPAWLETVSISSMPDDMYIEDEQTERYAVSWVTNNLHEFLHTLNPSERQREAIVILTCLGGFAGSCAARAVSAFLALRQIPHSLVATLPFQLETVGRRARAGWPLQALGRTAASTFVINGGAIEYQLGERFTLRKAFHIFDARVLTTLELACNTAIDVGFGDDLP